MRIGIIAALPGELKPLVRGWERLAAAKGSGIQMWQTQIRSAEVVAVCGGMGAAAARRAFAAAEFLGALDVVLSVGWAGALSKDCAAGECFEVAEVIDALTGERFKVNRGGVRLVTTPHVADGEEKRRLAASYSASLVDMEAAAVSRLAQMRDIPILCFKGVSDGAEALLPDLNRFIDVQGHLEMGKFVGHVAMRPVFWAPLMHLGRNSGAAAQALAKRVSTFLDEASGE